MPRWLALLILASSCASPSAAPLLDRGIVVTAEPQASAIGAAVLREGGGAVDAAIAVQFALAVTFPNAGNLGGGGFMLVHAPSGDTVIDYRETAPAAAHRDLFLDREGNVVPGQSLNTAKASGVPGSVAGMWLAHRKFGTLPWRRLLEPAIRLAEEGWTLDPWTAASFARESRNNFRDYYHGAPGSRLIQKELAATLRRIAEQGRDGFYEGPTARLIVEEMTRSGGIMTAGDLSSCQAKLRIPVEGEYRGLRVVSMPPPSSGGVALLELLHMAQSRDLGTLGFQSAAHLHLVAEMEKRVFLDRAEYLGDPDFVPVPVARLISAAYAEARMKDFAPDRRTDPEPASRPPSVPEGNHTTHFSIVDKWGCAVANTTTLNDSYGSGLVVRGAGFLLNNEMDDFSSKPGVPNLFGVTGSAANAIAPGKRMLSSMCPTFVFKNGRLWLVLGTPGGPTIFTTVFQALVNRVDFDMPLEKAVDAARFHHQWPPLARGVDPIYCEKTPAPEVLQRLKELGYTVLIRNRLGDVQAIELQGGSAIGHSDRRGIGRVDFE